MQTDSVEKAAGVGAIGLWAAMHGWLGWLVVLYAACMMLDCLTGTAQAIKNGISGLTLPFNYDMLLTPIVLFWYIVSELGSILENAEKMGASIPPLLKNAIEKMRDSDNDKHNTSV